MLLVENERVTPANGTIFRAISGTLSKGAARTTTMFLRGQQGAHRDLSVSLEPDLGSWDGEHDEQVEDSEWCCFLLSGHE